MNKMTPDVPEGITALLKTASEQLAVLSSPKVEKRLGQLDGVVWGAYEAHRKAMVLGNAGDIQTTEETLKNVSGERNVFKERAAGLKTKLEIVINSLATPSALSSSELNRRTERAKREIESAQNWLDSIEPASRKK
jgi:hypothetical protein